MLWRIYITTDVAVPRNIEDDTIMNHTSDFTFELVVPTPVAGRSPYAPTSGFPFTEQMVEDENARVCTEMLAKIQREMDVQSLLAAEADRRQRMLRKPAPAAVANPDRPLTKKEAAALLGVSERTVSRMVDDGELQVIKYGKGSMCRFNREGVERLRAVDKTVNHKDENLDQYFKQLTGG